MSPFLRKYATATATGTHIGIPMIKAGSQNFAIGADWTPAAGDVLLSIDGGTQANITTLPTYVNGQWFFHFTVLELTGKSICVAIVDSGTKAVEDQFFIIETFGHALAQFAVDFSDPVRFGLTALPDVESGDDGSLPTTGNGNNQIVLTNGLVTLAVGTHVGAIIPTVNDLTNFPALPDGWISTDTFASDTVIPAVAEVNTVNDKTGYQLDVDGMDIVSVDDPVDFADITTLPKIMKAMFWKLFGHSGQTTTQEVTRNGSDAVFATQPLSDDGVTQIRGKAF